MRSDNIKSTLLLTGHPPYFDEKELLTRIAGGDETAFETLFHQYVRLLHPYLMEMVRSREAAEDVIQNTFIRIWLQRDKLESVEYPRTWITKVAVHECLNMLRRQQTEKKARSAWQERTPDNTAIEQDIQYHQTRQFIQEAVATLAPQRRKIYEMNRIEGLGVSEIAEQLGLSVQTVKNTLRTSLECIRESLKQKGIYIPYVIFLAFISNFL